MKLLHWEYSFFLHTCHLGDRVRTVTNPFNGKPVEFPIDDGLTVAERNSVREVFAKYVVQGPEPEFEGYALYLPENGSVRFRGCDIDNDDLPITDFSVEIIVQELSDDVLNFLLEFARQGNMAFMSSIGDCVVLAKESNDPKIKKRWPDATIMQTADTLRSWLEHQIGGRKVHVPQKR